LFTGLIIETGEILSVKRRSGGLILSLKSKETASTAKKGDSISVNGVCLTVIEKSNKVLSFDISEETLQSTNIGTLKKGDLINLEPSLSADSRIGGHFVTGHVDAAGKIRSKVKIGDMIKVEIEAPDNMMNLLVEKGSVAIDGISLTVVDILKNSFTVVIIPHTAKLTTIGFKAPGDTVNIEADILGKYVAKFLRGKWNRDLKFKKTLLEEGYI
jgi:riboflavin synthase